MTDSRKANIIHAEQMALHVMRKEKSLWAGWTRKTSRRWEDLTSCFEGRWDFYRWKRQAAHHRFMDQGNQQCEGVKEHHPHPTVKSRPYRKVFSGLPPTPSQQLSSIYTVLRSLLSYSLGMRPLPEKGDFLFEQAKPEKLRSLNCPWFKS